MLVDPNEFVLELVKRLPRVEESVDVQVAMQDMYDVKFGIFNHIGAKKARPLSSVAFHPAEDISTGSRIFDTGLRYENSKIKEIFDMSFLEFISMPVDVIADLCTLARTISIRRELANAKNKDDIDRLMKELEGK